ncbi:hypothetical protein DTO166G4_6574 [Paecilomyces variotii]|nr:hypothetical protein DTO166G4_6574 [Paecilomyces variotii]KAJ9299993.1 hypothetical protein DTO217A2_8027 [Paecilomyces variotii]
MFSLSAKRPRGDDIEDYLQHDSKKPRPTPLPLRVSPNSLYNASTAQQNQFASRSIPPALTPADSSDDDDDNNGLRDANAQAAQSGWLSQLVPRPPAPEPESAMDLDMAESHPLAGGDNLSPWPVSARSGGSVQPSPIPQHLINQSLNISGGRTATPIYGHFTVNMNVEAMMEDDPSMPTQESAPSSNSDERNGEPEWWRRRRLPSPISEDEDRMSNNNQNYGTGVPNDQGLSVTDTPPLGIASGPTSSWSVAPERGECGREQDLSVTPMEASTAAILRNRSSFADLAGNGRESIVNNAASTAEKGKISFSMGYRADCDKCRRRVPGHYSHIIRS